jgi:hypothetical protein
VRKAARNAELSLNHEIDIGRLAEAEHFAKQGNLEKVGHILSQVGAWVLDFAKQTGSGVLAQYLGGFIPK